MDASPVPLREPLRARRIGRRRLTPAVTLSVLAHALLFALAILWARRPIQAPEWLPPPSFDVIFEGGSAVKPTVRAPEPHPKSETPPESAPAPPPTPPAAPAMPARPAPIQPRLPTPSEAPAPRVSTPVPMPSPVPSPEPSPPPPLARPVPVQPPRRPAPARPAFPAPMNFSLGGPAAPPSVRRSPGHGIDLSFGSGSLGAENTRIFGRSDSKEVGPDWFNRFAAWWDRHSYYPPQAGAQGEQGDVVLDLVIRRSGRVEAVRLASGSGSQWLDLAALGVFRDALLPELPSDAAASVPLHLTIHYAIIRR